MGLFATFLLGLITGLIVHFVLVNFVPKKKTEPTTGSTGGSDQTDDSNDDTNGDNTDVTTEEKAE